MPSIKPTVWSPHQPVRKVVTNRICVEPVKQNLRRSVGNVIAIRIRNEHQLRWCHHIDTAKANFDAGHLHALVPEDGSLVEDAVVVCVFQNQNSITQLRIEVQLTFGVGIVFNNPQPATFIDGESDWLPEIWFRSKHGGSEARRHFHLRQSLFRSWKRKRQLLTVVHSLNSILREACGC